MVDGIGKSALAREAIASALRTQADRTASVHEQAAQITAPAGAPAAQPETDFSSHLVDGVQAVDAKLKNAGSMPQKMLTGEVEDFHEVAVQLRQADLSFKFAMEIRNKLIDAYREVMRMSV